MSNQPEANGISLNGLSHLCQRESELFFQRLSFDPQFCFELFRRAFTEGSQEAWEIIYSQYRLLVISWIERHPIFHDLEEEADFFLNRAFEKMWAVVTPAKFNQFTDLRSLLRYLQLCVHSVIVDYSRRREQTVLLDEDVEPVALAFADPPESGSGVESQVARRQQARAAWDLLRQRLKTPQEQTVAYAMWVLDFKPRQVLEEFQGVFSSIHEIYTVKENLIDRLRRDDELFQVLSGLERARPAAPKGHAPKGSLPTAQ